MTTIGVYLNAEQTKNARQMADKEGIGVSKWLSNAALNALKPPTTVTNEPTGLIIPPDDRIMTSIGMEQRPEEGNDLLPALRRLVIKGRMDTGAKIQSDLEPKREQRTLQDWVNDFKSHGFTLEKVLELHHDRCDNDCPGKRLLQQVLAGRTSFA